MTFLVLILLVVVCTGAVPIPTQTDCGVHKHVENLYNIRSKGSCDHPFNGQQLSSTLCQASSLASYEAVDTGNCVIIFSITINPGVHLYGGHLAIYLNQYQSPQLDPTLTTLTLIHPTMGNISSRPMPASNSSIWGWQIFSLDPIIQGLPPGTHKIIFELKAHWKEWGPMTCGEVGRTYILHHPSIGWQSKVWLEANLDTACLLPLLTVYTNGSLSWKVPSSTTHYRNPGISSGRGLVRREEPHEEGGTSQRGRSLVRREVSSSSIIIHDYVLHLYEQIPGFKKLSCNATFNKQQVSADVCRFDRIKTFTQLNNSCTSDGWTVAFNVSLHEEMVLGAQLVLYLNRSTANSTDPLLMRVYQGDALLTEKAVPPSLDGWQLLNITQQRWPSDGWEVLSFTIRVFKVGGSNGEHLVPIKCWEVPDWITPGGGEGADYTGDESDAIFAPILTVFVKLVSQCRKPWPWQCLGPGNFGPFGRRSVETERQLMNNSDTTSNNKNNNKSNNNRVCSIKDRWVPSSHLTAALQTVSSSNTTLQGSVVVLPKSLNARECTDQCPNGQSPEGTGSRRGLGTCCSQERYGQAHVVVKRAGDSSYLTTTLDNAVVEECGPAG